MRIVVAGTDTNVGKTIFSAALVGALGAHYWKPVQAGLDDGGDSALVRRLSGSPPERIIAEAYRLAAPCSPHRAAELDGLTIEPGRLVPPAADPLVIEGAGGLLVPLRRDLLLADLVAAWGLPVVLVARTTLGTINHSLLSIEALRRRGLTLVGIAFVGDPAEDSEATIAEIGRTRRLGRLPLIAPLDRESLRAAFAEAFDPGDFE